MTGLIIFAAVMLLLALFVGFCVGYYFGCRDEARQMRRTYATVNATKAGIL